MPPVESTQQLKIGAPCPGFRLPDVTLGRMVGPGDFAGMPLLVAFICNHCPFVVHIRHELAALSRDARDRGWGCVYVCSNDETTHPADGPGPMKAEAAAAGYACPYLHDADQSAARAFHAACTPDFFLFDRAHRLAYAGQLDGSRPKNGVKVTGADLRAAIDAVLAGHPCAADQKRSIGCSIKWRT